ncbi:MAG: hydroxyphenylacetyl-CoA thioesterase PaaI [Woeseiaceae bacterium]|nr:hydroxyphenylacetyl-CoA thioesterase PaaI [Woeseiaceae bacterium]
MSGDAGTKLDVAKRCAQKMFASDHASNHLGMSIDIPAPGEATVTMTIRADMVNGFDVCHGGFIFALADSAFAFACNAHNRLSVAASANIDFLRPAKLGDRLTARAVEQHAGQSGGVYSVRVENQHGKAVAEFRGRSASRDEPLLK